MSESGDPAASLEEALPGAARPNAGSSPARPSIFATWGARPGLVFGAVGILAFAFRALYILSAWHHPAVRLPVIDAEAYRARALQILDGDWLGDAVYYLDPLYPFFLAAVYAVVPPDSVGVLLAQAALDSVSVVLLMSIAKRVFGDPTALVAGLLAATYKPFFFYDALLLKAPLMIFLMVVALYFVTRAADRDRLLAWWPAGFFLGLAALTRGNSLLFAPTLGLFLLFSGQGGLRRRVLAVAVLGIGLACAIAPVSLRNYVVGDDLVLLNSQAGQNFYIGHFEGNDSGAYKAPPFLRPNPVFEEQDFANEARRLAGKEMKPSEISSFWLAKGMDVIADDPMRFLRHSFRKTLVLFNHYEIPDNASYEYFALEVSSILRWPLPSYALVLALSVGGLLLSWRRPLCMILALFVFSYSAGILLFFNLSRLRLPIVPVLIMFAAFALVRFAQMARLRDWRPMALPFVVVLAFFGVSQLDLTHQNLNIRYFNMGVGFLTQSERSWAAAEALRESGDIARATLAERRAFEQRDFADEQFVRGLAHDPDYQRAADALRNSMLIRVVQLNQLEAWERAAEVGVGLVNRFPSFVPGHVVAGRALERAGRVGPARRVYRRALRLDPGNSAARLGLKRIEQEGPGSRAPGAD